MSEADLQAGCVHRRELTRLRRRTLHRGIEPMPGRLGRATSGHSRHFSKPDDRAEPGSTLKEVDTAQIKSDLGALPEVRPPARTDCCI